MDGEPVWQTQIHILVGKDPVQHHKETPAVDSQPYRELSITVSREDAWTTVQRRGIMVPAFAAALPRNVEPNKV